MLIVLFPIKVHQLKPDVLKQREVVKIDIANDAIAPADYKADQDPSKFKSKKTGRGPLKKDWISKVIKHHVLKVPVTPFADMIFDFQTQPIMTCYKLVTCEFKWFGLQTRVENFIHKSERRLFTVFHRQVCRAFHRHCQCCDSSVFVLFEGVLLDRQVARNDDGRHPRR